MNLESDDARHATPLSEVKQQEQLAILNIQECDQEQSKDLPVIVQAMRKLREAIVAIGRIDDFGQGVYIFAIRATILLGQTESYHPALLHLLRRIHPKNPLPSEAFQEMLGYQVLDLACRQQDLNEAYRISLAYGFYNPKIRTLLEAIVRGNWVVFWKLESSMDRYQQRLTDHASDRMRTYVIDCIGKSYLNTERNYIEKAMNRPWETLMKEHTLQWRLEGDNVIVRQIKRK